MVKDNVMPETIEKLNNWRENKKSKQINVNRIVITHPIHQKTETIDFNGRINQLSYVGNRPVPIVVKKKRCGKYQLLFGLKQLIIAKLLNHKTINTIVINCTRERLVDYLNNEYILDEMITYSLKNIIISEDFAKTTPNPDKIRRKRREIKDGLIPAITLNENGVLVDGYITYLILKEYNVENVAVKIIV